MRNKVRALIMGASLLFVTAAPAKSPKVGMVAPPFSVRLFDKRKITNADMLGKVLVINIWATWCGPCKAEMPMMDSYHRRNKARGFEIFGVLTTDSASAHQLKELSSVLSYPLATGISGSYGILKGVPTSYIIDRKGIVRYAKAGAFDESEFRSLIDPLLAETP
jgi:cytochrome c biogenesis protein CcmG, thiol:disulfide interchange protein DsbE